MQPILSIENLHTAFGSAEHPVYAVQGASIRIHRGATVALVGESGSGKSMTALSVMALLPPPGRISSGAIFLGERNLCELSESDMRRVRGGSISMIFQDPMTSLNPVLTIGDQMCEPLMLHRGLSRKEAASRSVELLSQVGIPSAAERMKSYAFQLSGGMRQRVMIAMALACEPSLLIADEPTTALDVTIQAQILELLDSIRKTTDMGMLLITHDLAIVAERSDFTHVMYAGHILESAYTRELLDNPLHPYTRALLASLPCNSQPGKPLQVIGGQPPVQTESGKGCVFYSRCHLRIDRCAETAPETGETSAPGHTVACWKCQ